MGLEVLRNGAQSDSITGLIPLSDPTNCPQVRSMRSYENLFLGLPAIGQPSEDRFRLILALSRTFGADLCRTTVFPVFLGIFARKITISTNYRPEHNDYYCITEC